MKLGPPRDVRGSPRGWVVRGAPARLALPCRLAAPLLPCRGRGGALLPRCVVRRSWRVLGGLVGSGPPCRESQPPPWGQRDTSRRRPVPPLVGSHPIRPGHLRSDPPYHRHDPASVARRDHPEHGPHQFGARRIVNAGFAPWPVTRAVPRAPQSEPTRLCSTYKSWHRVFRYRNAL